MSVRPTTIQQHSFKAYDNTGDFLDEFPLFSTVKKFLCISVGSRVLWELCGLWRERVSLFHGLCQPH